MIFKDFESDIVVEIGIVGNRNWETAEINITV